jgi:hypothetical protein
VAASTSNDGSGLRCVTGVTARVVSAASIVVAGLMAVSILLVIAAPSLKPFPVGGVAKAGLTRPASTARAELARASVGAAGIEPAISGLKGRRPNH